MNQGLEIWLLGARALVLCATFAAFAWALLRMRREAAEQFARLEAAQNATRAEIMGLHERMQGLAGVVATLRETVSRLERPAEEPAPPVRARREPGGRSYETAKRLARSGATVEEIVATCGVAGTEARLLRRLHGVETKAESAA